MALIKTVQPENAEGIIKEGYSMFMEHMGIVPKPMEMLSASPALFEQGLKRIHYYSTHPTLSFALLAHIRYLAAHSLNYSFCMDFNKAMLKKQGVEEADFQKMEEDPSKSLLEENENAMLAFVINAMKSPGSATPNDIQKLKNLGWEERDVVPFLNFHN
jgi:hypothetical protein